VSIVRNHHGAMRRHRAALSRRRGPLARRVVDAERPPSGHGSPSYGGESTAWLTTSTRLGRPPLLVYQITNCWTLG
jgi:hypothetical protein